MLLNLLRLLCVRLLLPPFAQHPIAFADVPPLALWPLRYFRQYLLSRTDQLNPIRHSIDSIDSRITKVRSTRICTKFRLIVLIYIDMLIVLAKQLACYLAFLGP